MLSAAGAKAVIRSLTSIFKNSVNWDCILIPGTTSQWAATPGRVQYSRSISHVGVYPKPHQMFGLSLKQSQFEPQCSSTVEQVLHILYFGWNFPRQSINKSTNFVNQVLGHWTTFVAGDSCQASFSNPAHSAKNLVLCTVPRPFHNCASHHHSTDMSLLRSGARASVRKTSPIELSLVVYCWPTFLWLNPAWVGTKTNKSFVDQRCN